MRDAMTIEAFELPRHFAVARHHVKQPDHRDDGGVGRAQEQKQENNSDDPAENLTDRRRKRGGGKLFADEAQHVFAALSQNGRDLTLSIDAASLPAPTAAKASPSQAAPCRRQLRSLQA